MILVERLFASPIFAYVTAQEPYKLSIHVHDRNEHVGSVRHSENIRAVRLNREVSQML